MTKLVKEQLSKVTSLHLEFNDNDTELEIKKVTKIIGSAMKVGSVYIISLYNLITNPPPNSTLASNWNNGMVPKYSKYVVEVLENTSNMIKVNGVAQEDLTSQFIGWLPYNGFEVISKEE